MIWILVLSSLFGVESVIAVEPLALEFEFPDVVAQGEVFQVPIMLRQSETYLDTIRLDVQYNTQAFDVVHMELGNIFPYVAPNSVINDEEGRIYFGGYRTAGSTNQSGLFGTLTLRANDARGGDIVLTDKTLLLGAGKNFYTAEPRKYSIDIKGEADDIAVEEPVWVSTIADLDLNASTQVQKSPDASEEDAGVALESIVEDGLWYARGDEGIQAIFLDKTPPNVFLPFVEGTDDGLKIYFATTDQASGLDRYELYLDGKVVDANATSPHLLNDYKNAKIIEVKAFDKAGNVQVGRVQLDNIVENAEYRPTLTEIKDSVTGFSEEDFSKKRNKIIYIVLAVIGLFVAGGMIRSIKNKS